MFNQKPIGNQFSLLHEPNRARINIVASVACHHIPHGPALTGQSSIFFIFRNFLEYKSGVNGHAYRLYQFERNLYFDWTDHFLT